MATAAARSLYRRGCLLQTFSKRPQCVSRWYSNPMTPKHPISAFNRMVLRVTGTMNDDSITEVSVEKMDKANSRFRIAMMVVMMVFTAVGSAYAIMLGKRDAAAHINSVHQQNVERYARLKTVEDSQSKKK